MAGSIEANSAVYEKQYYKYVAPAPPSELVDSTNYVINFTERKFLNVGLDPAKNFDIMVHIITPSRYVSITPDFLKRIFSLMGNILSFILDTPEKSKKIVFLDADSVKLTNMVYRGENVMVIESHLTEGCRVLVSRSDLMVLQNLEWSILESVARKSAIVRPLVVNQFNQILKFADCEFTKGKAPPTNADEMKIFIKRLCDGVIMENVPKSNQSFISQIKMFAVNQLVEKWMENLTDEGCSLNMDIDEIPKVNNRPASSLVTIEFEEYNMYAFSPVRQQNVPDLDETTLMGYDENDGPRVFNTWAPRKKSPDSDRAHFNLWQSKRRLFED